MPSEPAPPSQPALTRQVGLGSAISLNMLNMVGIGPFITLPLVVAAMGGPQAFLGWIIGALIGICDGLVWAELGATMPEAGGSYAFLREIYGPQSGGRLASFLYVWQLCFSAPLSIASGCIGLAQYAAYLWPSLHQGPVATGLLSHIAGTKLVAAGTCVLMVILLYRNVRAITRMAWVLWAGMLLTIGIVIFAGLTHFNAHMAFSLPPGAFTLRPAFFEALGAATLITTYDYWGYYNVCFMGGEIKNPGRNIPRAVLISILVIAALYLLMSVSVLGVIPWQELATATSGNSRLAVVAVMLQRTLGTTAGRVLAGLVIWTAFSSVFALLLAFSRVPYVAALDGNFFRIFGRLHSKHNFPHLSLLALGAASTLFCFFDLGHVIAALVTIRIILQFVLQQVGVMVLRKREPNRPRPFRIWLYPLPPLFALTGFFFILFSRPDASRELSYGAVVAISGALIFFIRSRVRREWPFAPKIVQTP
ncbi:APC family permease [Granulicella sp. WH15]|uniref:APC family permease n=1 Tax=Granulicella sp. WH15 TaxID=2602070 RepID=UPI0013674A3F|nr:APC family permease [Granulicella sp. WH15]QHN04200.1 APC family permease [Granulicella sp. WH15]